MRIAIDVMGGDHSPDAILAGSLDALELLSPDDRLVLVGDEAVIREEIAERRLQNEPRLEVVPTTQVIGMAEPPVAALREKPDSSIARMTELAGKKAGEQRCDVIISAGNTGACVAAAGRYLRRLPGANRPGIAVTMPTFFGPVVICDVGANPDPRPHHLHQYARMAAIYANKLIGLENPRVALMSIGGEEGKGTPLVKESHKLLKSDQTLNYVGYAEGRDIFDGKADVIVTEGFTGNVILKLAEGLAAGLFRTIAHEIFEEDPDLAMKFEPIVKKIYKKHDYHEYGGAPLLGANGILLICHGSSEARTITAAVRAGIKYAKYGVNNAIVEALAQDANQNEPASEEVA
ncbi:MAG: phosphate acyltransferase PlsX [Phycisphaeraceae bacterium]